MYDRDAVRERSHSLKVVGIELDDVRLRWSAVGKVVEEHMQWWSACTSTAPHDCEPGCG